MKHILALQTYLILAVAFMGEALPIAKSHSHTLPSYLRTPVGLVPHSAAHQVPVGATISHTQSAISLLAANGTALHTTPVVPGATNARPLNGNGNGNAKARREESGWVTFAAWLNTGESPIASFATSWTVPPAPAANDGQTVFIFNSIEPADFTSILQPVLQYGGSAAGGGNYWGIACWYVTPTGTYFTPLVQVQEGQTLTGYIQLQEQSANSTDFQYLCEWSNLGGYGLLVNSAELVWATETLEVYGIQSASDFPAGTTALSAINIATQETNAPNVTWSVAEDVADTVFTTVIVDGSVNALINITYPTV
ncbi:hypothetical protein HK100_001633 [Physocladia obscura]|uniref:Uncharacterized protein n=1 Tax=Physocladia obscura TaxID=109957 RepID=A0AAD5T7H9_9FUNG|nr:hypothetical protein HK100_001633 [Physocladia obscura]